MCTESKKVVKNFLNFFITLLDSLKYLPKVIVVLMTKKRSLRLLSQALSLHIKP